MVNDVRFGLRVRELGLFLTLRARRPEAAERLKAHGSVARFQLRSRPVGWYVRLLGGPVHVRGGLHPSPDVVLEFRDVQTALRLLRSRRDRREFLSA